MDGPRRDKISVYSPTDFPPSADDLAGVFEDEKGYRPEPDAVSVDNLSVTFTWPNRVSVGFRVDEDDAVAQMEHDVIAALVRWEGAVNAPEIRRRAVINAARPLAGLPRAACWDDLHID